MRLGEGEKSRLILRGDSVQAAGQQHTDRKYAYSGVHVSCLTARKWLLTVATTPYWSGSGEQINIELLHPQHVHEALLDLLGKAEPAWTESHCRASTNCLE